MNSLNTQNQKQDLKAFCFLTVSITSAYGAQGGIDTHFCKVYPSTIKGAYYAKKHLRSLVELSIMKAKPIKPITVKVTGFALSGIEVCLHRQVINGLRAVG